jgi:hypothetical protein
MAMVNSTRFEKFMTRMAPVYNTMVPRKLILRPYLSESLGMKVAEKVHPRKKLIPINAIVDLLTPKYKI